jgi:hypothetical protein
MNYPLLPLACNPVALAANTRSLFCRGKTCPLPPRGARLPLSFLALRRLMDTSSEHGIDLPTMLRPVWPLVLGLFVLASAKPSLADRRQPRVSREKAAKKACAMGDFEKGADILTDLYVETNDPTYVYNQGRCYQQNNRWEQAISRFREFLRKAKNLSDSDRADTERQIADCESLLGKANEVLPPPEASSSVQTAPVSPAPILQPSSPVVVGGQAQQPSAGGRGKSLRVAGVIVASVGVAAIGTGVVLALKANSLSNADYSRSREDERSSLRTWGLLSYGVGAAAIVTGTVLYVVGWTGQHSSSVALLPVVVPDGASVFFRGRF